MGASSMLQSFKNIVTCSGGGNTDLPKMNHKPISQHGMQGNSKAEKRHESTDDSTGLDLVQDLRSDEIGDTKFTNVNEEYIEEIYEQSMPYIDRRDVQSMPDLEGPNMQSISDLGGTDMQSEPDDITTPQKLTAEFDRFWKAYNSYVTNPRLQMKLYADPDQQFRGTPDFATGLETMFDFADKYLYKYKDDPRVVQLKNKMEVARDDVMEGRSIGSGETWKHLTDLDGMLGHLQEHGMKGIEDFQLENHPVGFDKEDPITKIFAYHGFTQDHVEEEKKQNDEFRDLVNNTDYDQITNKEKAATHILALSIVKDDLIYDRVSPWCNVNPQQNTGLHRRKLDKFQEAQREKLNLNHIAQQMHQSQQLTLANNRKGNNDTKEGQGVVREY